MKKYALFYGTLRRGEPNFNRFKWQTYIQTLKLKGYELYDCIVPIIVEGEGSIIVELHALTNSADKKIRLMEIGAGYKEQKLRIGDKLASLYIYDKRYLPYIDSRKIESGDWVKYNKALNQRIDCFGA